MNSSRETGRPLRIDVTRQDDLRQILPKSLILSSRTVGWYGLQFAYHRQPAHELPELSLAQHVVSIYTARFEARLKINRHWQSKSYSESDVGIFPANQTLPKTQFDQEVGSINLCLEPAKLAQVAEESVNVDRLEIALQFQIRDPLIQQIGLALKTELESGEVDSRLYVESAATMLAVHLLRRYSVHKPLIRDYTDGLPRYKLREAIAYIHDYLDQNLTLAEIAAAVQMSPHYFASLFKQSTGLAPHQYVTQCRIERAKHLLARQELSITQVSQQVGFQSQSHFAKVFRKHIGTTPKAYRSAL